MKIKSLMVGPRVFFANGLYLTVANKHKNKIDVTNILIEESVLPNHILFVYKIILYKAYTKYFGD